jgi:8-oxo-dGTP pyrophosphatase MutT (NUDIX family)
MKTYVVCVARFDGKFVMVRKERPAWQNGRWNFLGGRTEEGENQFQTASRKFYEECGVLIPPDLWAEVGQIVGNNADGVAEQPYKVFVMAPVQDISLWGDAPTTTTDEQITMMYKSTIFSDREFFIENVSVIVAALEAGCYVTLDYNKQGARQP